MGSSLGCNNVVDTVIIVDHKNLSPLKHGEICFSKAKKEQSEYNLGQARLFFEEAIIHLKEAVAYTIPANSDIPKTLLMQSYLELGQLFETLKNNSAACENYRAAQALGHQEAGEKLKLLAPNIAVGEPEIKFSNTIDGSEQLLPNSASLPTLVFKQNPAEALKLKEKNKVGFNFNDTHELADCLRFMDKASQDYLQQRKLALDVINAFAERKVKSSELIAELTALANARDKELTHLLFAKCIDPIAQEKLLNVPLLDGLGNILRHSHPTHFSKNDLVQILKEVSICFDGLHQQLKSKDNEEENYQFLHSLGRLLDAMVDAGVQGLSRETQHEPLYDTFLKRYQDGRLGFQAQYCRQALVRISNDESRWSEYLRRGTAATQGLVALWTAVKGLDPSPLLSAYENIKKATKTQESTQNWYDALRYAELLIEANQWLGFEYFIKNSSDRRTPAMVLGITQLLDRTILNHCDMSVRTQALQLLGQLFTHSNDWVSEKNIFDQLKFKIWTKPEGFIEQVLKQMIVYASHSNETIRDEAQQWLSIQKNDKTLSETKQQLLISIDLNEIRPAIFMATPPFSTQLLAMAQKKWEKSVDAGLEQIQNTAAIQLAIARQSEENLKKLAERPSAAVELAAAKEQAVAEKLKQLRQRVLSDQDIQTELASYIPVRGAYRIQDTDSFDLAEKITELLQGDKKVVLLLGNAGGGKSTFNRFLEQTLWQTFKPNDPIPLFISLPSLQHPDTNLLGEYFKRLGFTDAEIIKLQQSYRFNLILDGFDEINKLKNLYMSNQLNQWNAKVLISCRTEYLTAMKDKDYLHYFLPYHNDKPQPMAFQELTVIPFNDSQIAAYVKKHLELHPDAHWQNPTIYLDYIKNIPGLRQLIETPFLLMIAMDVMPRIVEKYANVADEAERLKVTQANLYDEFIQQWFEREQDKLIAKNLMPEDGHDVIEDFWQFAKSLGVAMHEATLTQVNYTAPKASLFANKSASSDTSPWAQFFGPNKDNPDIARARRACPLRKVAADRYAFMHASLVQYFATKAIYDDAMANDADQTLSVQAGTQLRI